MSDMLMLVQKARLENPSGARRKDLQATPQQQTGSGSNLGLTFDTPHLIADAEEDERGLPRRKAATTIDTATAEEDVKDFDVPEKI